MGTIRELNFTDFVFGTDTSVWEDIPETPTIVPDFEKLYSLGAKFNFLRASFGMSVDKNFKRDWLNARKTKLILGAYHFLVWDKDPKQQANFFWSLVKDDPGELPLIVDFEWWSTIPSNAFDILYNFLEQLKTLTKKRIGIYTATSFWNQYGKKDTYWKQYILWLAHYDNTPPTDIPLPWTHCDFWQYTGHGDGLYYGMESKDLDLDYFLGNWSELQQICDIDLGEQVMWDNSTVFVSLYNDNFAKLPTNADFKALATAGVEIFGIPMLSTKNEGLETFSNINYSLFYDKAKETKRMVAGIIKVHPRLDEINSWNSCTNLISAVDIIAGSLRVPDIFVLVFEDFGYTDYRGFNPFTPGNMLTCVKQNCELLYKKFGRPVLIELAWGASKLKFYDPAQGVNLLEVWLGNQNATQNQERFPFIGAYYPSGNYLKVIPDVKTFTSSISYPDGLTESTYLNVGNSKWRGWEVGQFINPAVTGPYFRIIMMKDKPSVLYPYLLTAYPGVYGSTPTPSTPIPPTNLEQRVTNLETKLDKLIEILKTWSNS